MKTTIEKFKNVMIDMYKGYPQYVYFGTFEKEFGREEAERIIHKLKNEELISVDYDIENKKYYYELTKKGMDFAIAMVNLNHSQETHYFTRVLIWFTRILVLLTFGLFVFALFQAIITLGF